MGKEKIFEFQLKNVQEVKTMVKRQRICRKIKGQSKKRCYYVTRNKKGQITNVNNIGRSTRQDARIKAKRKLRPGIDRGKGMLGDFPKRRQFEVTKKMVEFGFVKQKRKSNCKTFETRNAPNFDGNNVNFEDLKTGVTITDDANKVKSFRRTKEGNFKLRICKNEE